MVRTVAKEPWEAVGGEGGATRGGREKEVGEELPVEGKIDESQTLGCWL